GRKSGGVRLVQQGGLTLSGRSFTRNAWICPENPVVFGENAAVGGLRGCMCRLGALTGQHPGRPARMTRAEPAILRLIGPLALVLAAATLVCSVLGFALARQADDNLEAAHRRALNAAIEALQAVSPRLSEVEPRLVRIWVRATGIGGLRFDPDQPAGGLEVQSLIDRKGRIVGWFAWEPERPATRIMLRLLPLAVLIAAGLIGFAVLA